MRRYEKRHAHDDSFGCVDLSKATDLVKAALSKTGVLTDMTNITIKSRSKRHY
jgi:murein L,D-transpeptidase YcbB/YkuD